MIKLNGLERIALCHLREVLGDDVAIVAQESHLPGKPDFVVDALRLVIQVDGDFFHDTYGKMTRLGLRRAAGGDVQGGVFWLEKASVNRARDKTTTKSLRALGYTVVRLRENRLRGHRATEYVSKTIGLAMLASTRRGTLAGAGGQDGSALVGAISAAPDFGRVTPVIV